MAQHTLLVYKKADLSIVNVVAGNIGPNPRPEDFGHSSTEYAIYDRVPPDYTHRAKIYALRRKGERVVLLLRPYYLHLTAVSGGTIVEDSPMGVALAYQAEVPIQTEFVFRVEKRDTTRKQIAAGNERIKIAIPLGVPVISPVPPVLTLSNGAGEVRIGAFEFPATLETHVYPLDNIEDIIDCRLFKHFKLKE